MRKSVHRIVVVGSVAVLALAAVVSGQGRQPATPADELLAEVRSLRADVNAAARAQMRAQLLGMRLQLQEQRIAAVSRQLMDVQERLRASQQAQTTLATQLKAFPFNADDPEVAEGFAQIFAPLKGQLVELDRADQRLKTEEAELLRTLQAEQARWSAFNAQIEELERAAAASR
jgi:hypothetical protein